MYKKRTLYLLAAALVIEAVVIVCLPSRIPRAVRGITAAVNVVAVVAVLTMARQSRE